MITWIVIYNNWNNRLFYTTVISVINLYLQGNTFPFFVSQIWLWKNFRQKINLQLKYCLVLLLHSIQIDFFFYWKHKNYQSITTFYSFLKVCSNFWWNVDNFYILNAKYKLIIQHKITAVFIFSKKSFSYFWCEFKV